MAFGSFKYEKNLIKNIIEVKERKGIPPEHRDILYSAMRAVEARDEAARRTFRHGGSRSSKVRSTGSS